MIEVVDGGDAVDLGEQSLDEPEVAAGDACDGGDRFGVFECAGGQLQSEFGPVLGEYVEEFLLGQWPRCSWANPTRL